MKNFFSILPIVFISLFFCQCKPQKPQVEYSAVPKHNLSLNWKINKNGSFGVEADSLSIQHFFPQIDGQTIHPISFKIDTTAVGGTITYVLDGKKEIQLVLANDSNSLTLSSFCKGFDVAPAYFCPAGSGEMIGADRLFKQGLGFGGPSALMPIPREKKRVDINGLHEHVWSYDSYLISGIIAPNNNSIAIGVYDHKQFLQRTTFYNKHNRFGLLDRWEAMNKELIDIGFSTESIPLKNKELVLPTLHFTSEKEPFKVLKSFATNMARHNSIKLTQPPAYHWCSWYESQKNFNEKILDDILGGLEKIQPKLPIQTVQIDDGYFTYYGDWLHFDSTKFPSGFENNVKKIKAAGYRAGVWIGPFMVHERSEMFKNHPDWILHNLDGSLVLEWENKEEGNTYILDASNPEAFKYLRSVFRALKKMGFTYFKTDFMDWGLRNSLQYKRYATGKTSAQYMDDVLKMIREEIGPESFWLGCIMPFPSAVGYVDAIRNSNDVGTTWSIGSQGNMIQESMCTQHTNNVLWQIDPDVLYMNSFKTNLTATECNTLALFDGMLGGVTNTSDRFHNMSKESLMLWRFIQPSAVHSSAVLPFFANPTKLKVLVRNYTSGTGAILFTNDADATVAETFNMAQVVNTPQKHLFQWQPALSNYIGLKSMLEVSLKPHESVLYYFSDENVAPAKNLGLYGIPINGL